MMTTGATYKSARRRAEPVPAVYFSPRYSNISLKNADAFMGFSKQFFMLETRLSIVVAANPTVAISAVSANTAASITVLTSVSPSLMCNMASPIPYSAISAVHDDGALASIDVHSSQQAFEKAAAWQDADAEWQRIFAAMVDACGSADDLSFKSLRIR